MTPHEADKTSGLLLVGVLLCLLCALVVAGIIYAAVQVPLQGDSSCYIATHGLEQPPARINSHGPACHQECRPGALWWSWGHSRYCAWTPDADASHTEAHPQGHAVVHGHELRGSRP